MLHAYLYTICFVFCDTSWRSYVFSGTNILTRCHSASSLFSAVFVFQKSYTGNILGIGRNKSRTAYFYRNFAKTEDETEGGQEPGSPQGGATQPLAAPPYGEASWPTSDDALSPIKSPRRKNLRDGSLFHEIYCKPPPSLSRDWEDPGALPGTLSEREIPAEGLLHHHDRLRSDV
jgi:hypothetical protein